MPKTLRQIETEFKKLDLRQAEINKELERLRQKIAGVAGRDKVAELTVGTLIIGETITTTIPFVTMALTGDLDYERQLSVGDGLDMVDSGANAAVTLSVDVTDLIGVGLTEDGSNNLIIGTPTSGSVSSANSVSGTTHSHEIVGSSNPGAAESLLETNGSGFLQLVKLISAELENAGNITLDAINDAADSTVFVLNSDGSYLADLNVEGDIVVGGTVDGVDIQAHAARHILGGADEIDGDQVDIDWSPANYTPATTPAEVTNVDHLTAHLYGIDQAIAGAGGSPAGNDTEIQFNNSGAFGADAGLTWTLASDLLTVQNVTVQPASNTISTFQVNQSDSTNVLIVDTTNARVGVGLAPSYPLDIAGIVGIDGVQIIYIPDQTDFSGTMVFGDGGTALAHAAGVEGQDNLIMGLGAGAALSTGSSNILIGTDAGDAITTGVRNVVIGNDAGGAQISGVKNVYIGENAGNLHTGQDCVFIGSDSGRVATTGGNNICIGTNTGYNLTIGISNTFIGATAGYASTSGSSNAYIGASAGQLMAGTNATSNVMIGPLAGASKTTGAYNVLIGTQAGKNNTTRWYNVFIGHMSGSNSTSQGSVFLGYQAGQNENTYNRLYIANSNTATPLIYGEFDTPVLKIYGSLVVNEDGVAGYDVRFESDNYDILEIDASDDELFLGGNASAKIGFYGVAAVTQPVALTGQLTTITHTAPGTPDYALQDLVDSGAGSAFGFATKDEGNTLLSVVANLQTRVGELETKLQALGLVA